MGSYCDGRVLEHSRHEEPQRELGMLSLRWLVAWLPPALGWGELDGRQADPSQRYTVKTQEAMVIGGAREIPINFSFPSPPVKVVKHCKRMPGEHVKSVLAESQNSPGQDP